MRYRIVALLASALAGAALYHFGSGQRYKLYVDAQIARCWAAVQEVTFSPAATRFLRAHGPERRDGVIEASIDFESRNVFAGTLASSATCIFDAREASRGPARIVVNGQELDAEIVDTVTRAIDRR